MRANTKRACVAVAVAAIAVSCLKPTEIQVSVTADPALCAALQTTIAAGEPGALVSVAETSARAAGCPGDPAKGDVGSIVVIPSGDRGAKIEVRVVAAVGKDPEACSPTSFDNCIEARRVLRFAKHQPLPLPVTLHASCIGKQCPDGSACVDGQCFLYDDEAQGYCNPGDPTCTPVGADGGADAEPDGVAPAACPSGRGPDMVRVSLRGATFCIDTTEVTDAQYAQFLATKPDLTQQIPVCLWNTGFGAAPYDDKPVANVDWCDAHAFCAWAGKRLCKTLDGSLPSAADASTATSEWYLACSSGGRFAYSYGPTYDAEACKTLPAADHDTDRRAVKLYSTCVGGFPGIYDMCGGVHEWVDGCLGTAGDGDVCRHEGGAYDHPQADQTCDFSVPNAKAALTRGTTFPDLGFRCCAD
jgi:formylglycine-generating enzyme